MQQLLLSLFCLLVMTHNVKALFDDVPLCDQKLISKIQDLWAGDPPTTIISKLKDDSLWALHYYTPELFNHRTLQSVSFNQKQFTVTYEHGESKSTTFNWSEKDGVLLDGSLFLYVLKQEVQMFAFYICNTQGPPGAPQGGVALALGPPGGIPEEATTAASEARETVKKLGISATKKLIIDTRL